LNARDKGQGAPSGHRPDLEAVWEADWIWRSRRVRINDFAYFRKEIKVRGALASAKLFYSAHQDSSPPRPRIRRKEKPIWPTT